MLRPHGQARPGERGDDPALRTLARAVLAAEPSLLDAPDLLPAAARHVIDQPTRTYLRGGVWADLALPGLESEAGARRRA